MKGGSIDERTAYDASLFYASLIDLSSYVFSRDCFAVDLQQRQLLPTSQTICLKKLTTLPWSYSLGSLSFALFDPLTGDVKVGVNTV